MAGRPPRPAGRGAGARVPAPAFDWRLSLADGVEDGPFSSLPGVDRWIAVARGGRMELEVGDAPGAVRASLDPTADALEFSGDAATSCRVSDGPLVDVNLMLRRGVVTGRMSIVTLAAEDTVGLTDVQALGALSGRGRAPVGDEQRDGGPLSPASVLRADPLAEAYEALVLGTRDYLRKTGFKDALVALSGRVRASGDDEHHELDGEVLDALIGTASASLVVRAHAPTRVALVRVAPA